MPEVDVKKKPPEIKTATPASPETKAAKVEEPLIDPAVKAAQAAVAPALVAGGEKTKAAGPDKPPKAQPFDAYNASPEVKALFAKLSATTDAKAAKPILAELKSKHKVPDDILRGVTHGDQGFFKNAKSVAKGPGWHNTKLGADGSVESEFHLNKKHIEFEGSEQRLEGNWDKKTATYEHKKAGVTVEAGAKDGGGYAEGKWGKAGEEGGAHKVRGAMTEKDGTTKYGASYVHTSTGDPKDKTDDRKESYSAGVLTKEKGIGAEGAVEIVHGEESHKGSAKVMSGEKKLTGEAAYTHKEGKKSQAYKGSFENGEKGTKVNGSVKLVEGKKSQEYKAGVENGEAGGKVSLSTAHKHGTDGKSSTSGNVDLLYGNTEGAQAGVAVDRKGFSANAKGHYKSTTDEKTDNVDVGGSVKIVKKGGKPKETTDDFELRAGGGYKKDNKAGTTQAKGNLGTSFGRTKIDGSVTHKTGTDDGQGFSSTTTDGKVSQGIVLSEKDKKMLNLSAEGSYTGTTKPGEESTWKASGTAALTEGEKKNKTSHSLTLGAEKTTGENVAKGVGLPGELKPEGYGNLFSMGTNHQLSGGHTFGTNLKYGNAGGFNMGSVGANWSHKEGKETLGSANLNLGGASGNGYSGVFGNGAFDLKLGDKFTAGGGGGFSSMSGPQGEKNDFYGYGKMGYNWSKDGGVDFKTGVAGGTGQDTRIIPELGVNFNKDTRLSAMGSFSTNGGQHSAGAKLSLPGGISVLGGYGNMSDLTNPYAGNSGMTMPTAWGDNGMGQGMPGGGGGFIGVQADLLKMGRKLFGK